MSANTALCKSSTAHLQIWWTLDKFILPRLYYSHVSFLFQLYSLAKYKLSGTGLVFSLWSCTVIVGSPQYEDDSLPGNKEFMGESMVRPIQDLHATSSVVGSWVGHLKTDLILIISGNVRDLRVHWRTHGPPSCCLYFSNHLKPVGKCVSNAPKPEQYSSTPMLHLHKWSHRAQSNGSSSPNFYSGWALLPNVLVRLPH